MAIDKNQVRSIFFFSLLLGVLFLTAKIFLPFFATLSVAVTLAVVVQPAYTRILQFVRGSENIAALLTLLLTVILILFPLLLIGVQIVREAAAVSSQISGTGDFLNRETFEVVERYFQQLLPQVNIDLGGYAEQVLRWVVGNIGSFFAGTLNTFLHMFLGFIALFYFLRDGKKFLSVVVTLSPLSAGQDQKILARLEAAINSIIKGSLLIALLQGLSTGIGLQIFDVPSAVLWGSLAAVGSLIPSVGTAIVIVPAIGYLFLSGHTLQAVGLLIWGTTAVGLIDNMLGPILVGRGVRVHPLLVLFAVIGGIQFFGPVGFLLGPLVLSLLYALLDIYYLLVIKAERE